MASPDGRHHHSHRRRKAGPLILCPGHQPIKNFSDRRKCRPTTIRNCPKLTRHVIPDRLAGSCNARFFILDTRKSIRKTKRCSLIENSPAIKFHRHVSKESIIVITIIFRQLIQRKICENPIENNIWIIAGNIGLFFSKSYSIIRL